VAGSARNRIGFQALPCALPSETSAAKELASLTIATEQKLEAFSSSGDQGRPSRVVVFRRPSTAIQF
jgi:hypothetical protein